MSFSMHPFAGLQSVWGICLPSAVIRTISAPNVGQENVDGAWGCSRQPLRKAPPISVPVTNKCLRKVWIDKPTAEGTMRDLKKTGTRSCGPYHHNTLSQACTQLVQSASGTLLEWRPRLLSWSILYSPSQSPKQQNVDVNALLISTFNYVK